MPDKQIHLDIVTPQKKVYSDMVQSFTAPGVEGSFQILFNHAPFITNIVPGKVKFITGEGSEKLYATSGGTVEVHQNNITLLAETIESKEEIDIARAESSLQRAEKRLTEKQPGIDIERAKLSLLRALARIKVAGSD
jgi:F-type H+-transporting ATPase subunit epsilon